MATANTSPAAELIRARLAASGGALTWAEVMDLALYAPGAGYYRRGVRRIGRGGDSRITVNDTAGLSITGNVTVSAYGDGGDGAASSGPSSGGAAFIGF